MTLNERYLTIYGRLFGFKDHCDEEHNAVMRELEKELYVPRVAEVRLNDDKTLDEVVTKDGDQLEQMDFNHWFLQIADVAIWLYASGKITATYERRDFAPAISGPRDTTPAGDSQ